MWLWLWCAPSAPAAWCVGVPGAASDAGISAAGPGADADAGAGSGTGSGLGFTAPQAPGAGAADALSAPPGCSADAPASPPAAAYGCRTGGSTVGPMPRLDELDCGACTCAPEPAEPGRRAWQRGAHPKRPAWASAVCPCMRVAPLQLRERGALVTPENMGPACRPGATKRGAGSGHTAELVLT